MNKTQTSFVCPINTVVPPSKIHLLNEKLTDLQSHEKLTITYNSFIVDKAI